MANFAIAADENVIARGNKLIEELQEPGEKKGVTLNRRFDLVSTHLQEDQLKRSGVDTEALDASITNIRNLFTAALSGKEEIRTEYERRMAELRERNEELEKNYPDKNILVVCHGGIVRVIHSYFYDMTNKDLMTWLPQNCCIQCYEK